jgi:2-succinyl-6-hydroxy-2,4-cyclohexadiene-1-carboxylate synthase
MSRPALVFIHGFLGSLHDWGSLPHRIDPERWYTLLELPGHGDEADAEPEAFEPEACVSNLLAQIHSAAIDRFVVVGYSMGGRLGLQLALAAGPQCVGAVIESASPGVADEADRAARRAHDEAWAQRFEAGPMEKVVADWYEQPVFASLGQQPELKKELIARRARNSGPGVARALRGLGAGVVPSAWDRLGGLACPVLFIAGGEDRKYVDLAQRAAGLCRSGQAVIVPGSGHSVHVEKPDGFVDAVRDFLPR